MTTTAAATVPRGAARRGAAAVKTVTSVLKTLVMAFPSTISDGEFRHLFPRFSSLWSGLIQLESTEVSCCRVDIDIDDDDDYGEPRLA